MKSYFNKLATRATLTQPSSAAISKPQQAAEVRDPFAQVAPPDVSVERSQKPSKKVSPPGFDDALPKASPRRKRAKASRTIEPDPRDTTETVEIAPKVQPSAKVRVAEQTSTNVDTVRTGKDPSRERRKLETEVPLKLKPPEARVATPQPTTREPDEKDEPSRTEKSKEDADELLAGVQEEQAILLRKADHFMSELFSRTATDVKQNRSEAEHEEVVRLEPPVNAAEPVRLAQSQPTNVNEAEPAASSVVIGKLTVEVTPPQTASQPQQQIVVFRNGRSGTSGVPSARRFGLGQF